MQRAMGEAHSPGVAPVKPQISSKLLADNTDGSKVERKDASAPQSPQRKLSAAAQPPVSEVPSKPLVQKQASPGPSPKNAMDPQKTSDPTKSPVQSRQSEHKLIATAAPPKESGGFFGFGGGKAKSDSGKPTESVTGKMFGFGSSFISSASNLVTSTVQDQPKTTPPVSPKMPPAKDMKSPAQEKKKPEQPQQTKAPSVVQAKAAPSEHPKTGEASVKPAPPICPLCNAELNVGSKDPPNFSTCDGCKNTVCNQCGFNLMQNESEVSEVHFQIIHCLVIHILHCMMYFCIKIYQ